MASSKISKIELKDWLDPNNNDPNDIEVRELCFDNLDINLRTLRPANQYQTNNFVSISACKTINLVNSTVAANSHYVLRAGNSITISPGFETLNNVVFEAKIQGCQ